MRVASLSVLQQAARNWDPTPIGYPAGVCPIGYRRSKPNRPLAPIP